uniref:Uncharacterized protein n=1 Tax=Arundo donax TaxID=35708 RepID=A0A0A9H9H7_ARUDO
MSGTSSATRTRSTPPALAPTERRRPVSGSPPEGTSRSM